MCLNIGPLDYKEIARDPRCPANFPEPERCELCDETFDEFDSDGYPDRRSCGCSFCEVCDERTDADRLNEFNECPECARIANNAS